MINRLAGFGPFDTSFLPAAGLWTSASGVTIVAGGGRSGSTDDNCAAFSTASSSVLSLTVSPGDVAGAYRATYGLAVRVLSITDFFTVASIWTPISHFDLQITSTGVVRLRQTTSGVLLGTICQSAANVVPLVSGGCYLECQIDFDIANLSACQIRVSDQYGEMNLVAQGPLLALEDYADLPYTTFRLGGGVGESAATWRITDVYLNDIVPAATGQSYRGRLIYNDSYLGNTHIWTYYSTADGTNLSTGNTPWVPNTGSVEYTQIDEHPPDEDVSYLSADQSEQTSTFSYQSPEARAAVMLNCQAFAAIYGIQWDGRLRLDSGAATSVVPVVREIVGGTLATDDVGLGPAVLVNSESYLYYPSVMDRNPIDGQPFTFGVFYPASVGIPGSTELGIELV